MTLTISQISPVDTAKRGKLDLRPGTSVKVYQKIQEKGKTRLQVFEGMIIARKHGNEAGGTFTVRKVASGVGVEKIFPLYSPNIDKIEIVKRAKVRRAKLYFIRDKAAKEIRRRMKRLGSFLGLQVEEEETPVEIESESSVEEVVEEAPAPEVTEEAPAPAEEETTK